MLIIRGVNLFPSEVETLLLGVEEVAPHYQLIVERPGAMDELTVRCEPAASRSTGLPSPSASSCCSATSTGIRIAVRASSPAACRAARARRCGWWIAVRPGGRH